MLPPIRKWVPTARQHPAHPVLVLGVSTGLRLGPTACESRGALPRHGFELVSEAKC